MSEGGLWNGFRLLHFVLLFLMQCTIVLLLLYSNNKMLK